MINEDLILLELINLGNLKTLKLSFLILIRNGQRQWFPTQQKTLTTFVNFIRSIVLHYV